MPVVYSCDPGFKNVQNFVKYDPNHGVRDTSEEAAKILNLSRGTYNNRIWLKGFQKKLEKKLLKRVYQQALNGLCQNSLKGVYNVGEFEERYGSNLRAYNVLRKVYGSRSYRNWRFKLYKEKKKFDAVYVNEAVAKFEENAGGRDFVVAYGDGQFPLTMKGCGSSAHARLMRLLSKRVRVIMTNEYRTTKACPRCRNNECSMKQPKGTQVYKDRNDVTHRVRVHGLSQCGNKGCNTLWSRDYAASLNIGRSFVHYFEHGVAAPYLSR